MTYDESGLFTDVQPTPWIPGRHAAIGSSPSDPRFDHDGREMEEDGDLACAFWQAARHLAEHWASTDADDSLVVVVIYNYRHALELGLKAVIKNLLASVRFELRDAEPEPEEVRRAAGRLENTHSLADLVDDLVALARMIGTYVEPELITMCTHIDERDPRGDYWKYALAKARRGAPSAPAREQPVFLDVPAFARRADAAYLVLDSMLDDVQNMQGYQAAFGPDFAPGRPAPRPGAGSDMCSPAW